MMTELEGPAPGVTVVIPVRNGAATIRACLASVLATRTPDGSPEVVVVDNGSTDETPGILNGFGNAIRVIHEARRGAAAARNRGIQAARGRIVAFIDADSEVDPGWLAHLVPPLGDPRVGIAGGRILSVEPANRIMRFGERIHDQQRAVENEQPYVASGNWASRREVLLEVGMFNVELLRGQDVDLSWRIGRAGYRLVYVPDAVVRHHNERTIRGLLHEGFTHGLHGERLLSLHGLPRSRKRRRLRRALGSIRRVDNVVDGALAMLFDVGKVAGQLVAHVRGEVAPSPGAPSASGRSIP